MDIEKVIARNRENIRQAIQDYRRHTSQTAVLDDVSDDFINRLARDNAYSKKALRELFSQSPVWDEELDALVINGTRTHDPDPERIRALAEEILSVPRMYADYGHKVAIDRAIKFFMRPNDLDTDLIPYIEMLAPKAYAPGRKLSRVFLALCKALGCADESKGSEFQKLYAQFADELTTKKISFKLFVSINPAHFITMSNPKCDRRGNTLTSCHSFNSTDYDYNNGCSGYARDEFTFIAFTVADPRDAETFNNRKTTRQIFAYRPGGGLLLQSRMYNTSGGVRGASADSKLYRDLVQREISAIERVPNLWKTYHSYDSHIDPVPVADGFGGYADWTYDDFDGHVSIRTDHEDDVEPMPIGAPDLCIVCGEENSDGLYCEDCKYGHRNSYQCDDCGEWFDDEDDLYTVLDNDGEPRHVCESCRDRYYSYCDYCEECYPDNEVTCIGNGDHVCQQCLDEHCEMCEECGDYFDRDNDMFQFRNSAGEHVYVCRHCFDRYYVQCARCGEYIREDEAIELHDANGEPTGQMVCDECEEHYEECEECGRLFEQGSLEDGLCRDCRPAEETEQEEALSA